MEYSQEIQDILEKNSLFKGLTTNDIKEFSKILILDQFKPGENIVIEGDNPDKIYVILKGRASVIKSLVEDGETTEQEIAVLKTGDSIGDVTLIDRQPRSATVRALDDTETISFQIDQLASLSHHEDSIEAKLKINFALRLSQYLRNSNANTLSERKKHKSEMVQLTNFDVVTGLPNQYLFKDKLAEQLLKNPDDALALIQIEIVDYKEVCDAMGTEMGDLYLTSITERLSSGLPDIELMARVGFNQFMILYTGYKDPEHVSHLATRIIRLFSNPVMVNEDNIFSNIYIGVSHFPDDGIQPEVLMKRAGFAVDAAKLSGPNSFAFYDSKMDELVIERRKLIQELHEAFENDLFELYYQAQVELSTGKLIGVESLIRWIHPEKGMISPVVFIPIVEQTGMIVELGYWIFKTACMQAKLWSEAGRPVRIAVNLSSIQFMQKDLIPRFKKILEEVQVSPSLLELELTESIMVGDIETTIAKLKEFADMGFILAIDDFGTGYSSLSYLRKLPIHKIKIDQSFVKDISKGDEAQDIVRCIVAMAKGLRLHTIAEGIEDETQQSFLNELEVDEGQGYLFSKPITAGEIEAKFFNS